MNRPHSIVTFIFGIVIGSTLCYFNFKKINDFDDSVDTASSPREGRGLVDLIESPPYFPATVSNSSADLNFAEFEQSLNGMDAMTALKQMDGLPLSNALSNLQDLKVDQILNSQLTAQDVLSLRSLLPVGKYHRMLEIFTSRLDLANVEHTTGSLQTITRGFLDSKEKAAFLKGIGECLKTTNGNEAIRLAGQVEDAVLGVEIITEFIKRKDINDDDIQILLSGVEKQSTKIQSDIVQAISQRIMEKSPIEGLKLAASTANPNVLENVISESINFQNMVEPEVSSILGTTTPGAQNALAEKMSKQILGSLNDKKELLKLLKLPYPTSIKDNILSKVGYSLSLAMPDASFDNLLREVDDESIRLQLMLRN